MNASRDRVVPAAVRLLAAASSLPPLSTLLMRFMLTQMLVQIPLIFLAAASSFLSLDRKLDANCSVV